MPFNPANPADNEKIRRLGIVIRPNWKAIEEGSQDDANPNKLKYWAVNLYERNNIPSAPGVDAPQVTDGLALYSKTDSDSGLAELFYRSENASIVQLSKYIPNIAPGAFTNNGETFLAGGLLLKYAKTATQTATSQAYTWAALGLTAFPNNCFVAYISPIAAAPIGGINTITKTGFTINQPAANSIQYNVLAIGN